MEQLMIGRPVNGVTLNGMEYVCGDDGKPLLFGSENECLAYIRQHGYSGYYEIVKEEET